MPSYVVRTGQGTVVCFDPAIGGFAHHAADATAFLIRAAPTVGFFVALDPGSSSATLMPVRVRDLSRSTCSLIDASTSRLFCAEPAEHPPLAGKLTGSRDAVGPWEVFTLQETALPPELEASELVRDLRYIASLAPSLSDLVAELALDVPRYSLEVLRAYAAVLPSTPDMLAALLMAHPSAAARIAGPDDPWMRQGLPDLARWLQDRDGAPGRRVLSGELDWLVDHGRAKPPGQECTAIVRSAVVPRRRACVVATARNEGIYLLEWIAYHRAIGFEHFFLYSNDNDDGSDALLGALADAGVITWIDNRISTPVSPQLKAYVHALSLLPDILDYEWALIIDLDEFFVFDTGRFASVHDFIAWQSVQPVDAVTLNWLMFGTFGTRRYSLQRGLTERFVTRHAGVNEHIKCLCRPRLFVFAHAHHPVPMAGRHLHFRDSNGAPYAPRPEFAHSVNPVDDSAWINHYWSKSIDELLCKFARNRGDLANVGSRSPLQIVEDIATRVLSMERDATTLTDRRIWRCAPGLQAGIEDLLRLPGVRQACDTAADGFARKVREVRRALADIDEAGQPAHIREALDLIRDDHAAIDPNSLGLDTGLAG